VLAALELPPERFVRAIGDVADVIRTNPFGAV
jgi:hypothetical protein